MHNPLNIVIIRAAGYTGATWVNVVLGCHRRAMAMGPPNRFWKLESNAADQACLIHSTNCPVWPALIKNPPSSGGWFKALAETTGKDTFILNYPDKAFYESEIAPLNARILHIKLVRDGRASLFSRMNHQYGIGMSSAFRNIMEWQIPKWDQIDRKLPAKKSDYFFLRYEDLVNEPVNTLQKAGTYIGLDYDPESALRFWEWEHHLTAGNVGMLDMICRLQGLPGHTHARSKIYDEVIARVKAGGPAIFLDESWKNGFTHADRLAFDCLLGERNADHGYERDTFNPEEISGFWSGFEQNCAAVYQDLAQT